MRGLLSVEIGEFCRGFAEAAVERALEPDPCFLDVGRSREAEAQVAPEHELRLGMAALSGLAEPAKGGGTIHRHVMPTAIERAEAEHRAAVPQLGGPGELAGCFEMVTRAAASVHHHLGERDER